jgi:hypothetical protein
MNEQQRAVVQQALEVIETPIHEQPFMAKQKAITALRQLLEQPEPVPDFSPIFRGITTPTQGE